MDSAPPLASSNSLSAEMPWQSAKANAHHAWIEKHWENIERACREYRPQAGRVFDYRDLRPWLPLPEESLNLLARHERGDFRQETWQPAWRACERLLPRLREGITREEARSLLRAEEAARAWPEHWEILLSTWAVAVDHDSDLVGALDNSALAIDLIASSLTSPAGGAAASAGYLVGRWIRENHF